MPINIVRTPSENSFAATQSKQPPNHADSTPQSYNRQLDVGWNQCSDPVRKLAEALKATFDANCSLLPTNATPREVLDLLKRMIIRPAKRGRPPDPKVTLACELFRRNMQWPKILRAVIPNFEHLSPDERTVETNKLQHAVGQRIRSRKRQGIGTNPQRFSACQKIG